MEDFLWDHGLESRMKIFFAWCTFSASVLQWWIKLQQRLINRGKDPCRTWKGMKAILQRGFDPPIEERVHKTTRVAAAISNTNFLPTKSVMKSFWNDSIIGDAGLTLSKQQDIAIKPVVKKVAAGATSLHGPRQQVLHLSSKSNDNMDNIESDISVGTKLNQHSSWSDSIIGEKCSNKHRVHDAKIKHPKKKIVFVESSSLPTTKGTIPTHGSTCREHKVPHYVETPNRLLHCKRKNAVSSEHFASVNLHDTQSTTIEHHEEMAIAKSTDIAPTPVQSVLDLWANHSLSLESKVSSALRIYQSSCS
jgi:hypothetical protein